MTEHLEEAAIELIRAGVEPAVKVDLPRGGRNRRPVDLQIVLPNGKTVGLELRVWGASDKGSARNVVWILERATAELRQRLRDSDDNFVDCTGALRLHLPGFLVDRTDLTPARLETTLEGRNPFADRASRIPRALFAARGRSWTVQELAIEADLAISMASYVVNALTRRKLVETERVGREKRIRLKDPQTLIGQWTAEYNWRKNVQVGFHAPIGDRQRFIRRLATVLQVDWLLTLQAGGSLIDPHASWNIIHVYARAETAQELRQIGLRAGWKPASDGKVVLLAPYYRDSVWIRAQEIDSIPVVSDLQLILDLWHYPVRGREQAEVLLSRYQSADVATRAT